jgi:hypothetical protein
LEKSDVSALYDSSSVTYTNMTRQSRQGRLMRSQYGVMCILVVGLAMQIACSRSNNLLLGRVESTVAGHKIEVTDCYRTSVPQPRQLPDLPDGKKVYEFMPCRDADVLIRGDELIVNGTSYGTLKEGDVIAVDHGKVLINEHAALAKSQK